MNEEGVKQQLDKIRKAYDLTVEEFKKGTDLLDKLPQEFKNSERFKRFLASGKTSNSGSLEYKEYLDPKAGMKFLDVGCSANLVNYKLYEWSSEYYGIDISSKLIEAMKSFVRKNDIQIGGLYVADVSKLPFEDKFFDIVAAIGVLEYFDINYIEKALIELHRVLKPSSKIVLDMPNLKHPDVETMFELEEYLGRPRKNVPQRKEFEEALTKSFLIEKVDDSCVMIKYFLRKRS